MLRVHLLNRDWSIQSIHRILTNKSKDIFYSANRMQDQTALLLLRFLLVTSCCYGAVWLLA